MRKPGRYPAPCPEEPGLSSPTAVTGCQGGHPVRRASNFNLARPKGPVKLTPTTRPWTNPAQNPAVAIRRRPIPARSAPEHPDRADRCAPIWTEDRSASRDECRSSDTPPSLPAGPTAGRRENGARSRSREMYVQTLPVPPLPRIPALAKASRHMRGPYSPAWQRIACIRAKSAAGPVLNCPIAGLLSQFRSLPTGLTATRRHNDQLLTRRKLHSEIVIVRAELQELLLCHLHSAKVQHQSVWHCGALVEGGRFGGSHFLSPRVLGIALR